MNYLSDCFKGISYYWNQLRYFELELSDEEVKEKLNWEHRTWNGCRKDRKEMWSGFYPKTAPVPHIVLEAVERLKERHIHKGVAVDLGCGISQTASYLLNKGWTVYAVDSSAPVLQTWTERLSPLEKKWLNCKQLILVNKSIEEFEYPEKVHLITASESLPYCDPQEIQTIFLKAKEALLEEGIFASNFFPPFEHPLSNEMLRERFGGWTTSKNVIEGVVRRAGFPSWSVTVKKSLHGTDDQFHVYAQHCK